MLQRQAGMKSVRCEIAKLHTILSPFGLKTCLIMVIIATINMKAKDDRLPQSLMSTAIIQIYDYFNP